jgi:maleylpyruvate isomerase
MTTAPPGYVLHGYFRSSTSFRVRIALNLKGIPYAQVAHHLRKGEQRSAEYLKLNPQGLVPSLVTPEGEVLTQSLAIMAYLDERHSEPPLLPRDLVERAKVRAAAEAIALDVHPIGNLRVLNALRADYGADDAKVAAWFRSWAAAAFDALERHLATTAGPYCFGAEPTLADICLAPQVINGARFQMDMTPWPAIRAIHAACMAHPAFAAARPEAQPDAE